MSDLENTSDDIITSQPQSMSNIDKMTLELLINKSQYKKYIQKNNPSTYSESQIYLGKINKYSNKILQMFSSLLSDPDLQITTDINNDFTHFVKTSIQYFEMKEMESIGNGDGSIDEEDVLFGNMEPSAEPSESSSLWGSKISKSTATNYIPKYTMDMYVKHKNI